MGGAQHRLRLADFCRRRNDGLGGRRVIGKEAVEYRFLPIYQRGEEPTPDGR